MAGDLAPDRLSTALRRRAPAGLALCLAVVLAPVSEGNKFFGTLPGVFPPNPLCCDSTWFPPNETGTAPSEIGGVFFWPYSFFVAENGVYTFAVSSAGEEDYPGMLALYAPPFESAEPLDGLIAVSHSDFTTALTPKLEAYLAAGVVYRLVTSNLDDEIHRYRGVISGPGEIFTSGCFAVGDELDRADDGRDGFALQHDRFCLQAEWSTVHGTSGIGQIVPYRSDDSLTLWFFEPENWELQVKLLDACAVNGHFWLFFAATTDVEFELRVFGRGPNLINPLLRKTYVNPQGHRADAVTDTAAFPCSEVMDE